MSKSPTWNDLQNGNQADLKRVYKLDQRGLEQAVRKHWDGANTEERRKLYETVYSKRSK